MAFQRYNKNYVSMTSAQAETAYRLTVQVIINAGFLRRKNMNITKEFKENVATLNVSGRLDTTTAPALEAVISKPSVPVNSWSWILQNWSTSLLLVSV
jgi:hypothetical protein